MKHSIALALVLFAACASSSASSEPSTPPAAPAAPAAKVGAVIARRAPCEGIAELTVSHEGIDFGFGMADQMLRIQDGKVSVDALRGAIAPDNKDALCANVAEIAASDDATYADLVALMDAVLATGRTDIGVIGGSTAMYPDPPRPKRPSDEEFFDALAKPPYDPAKVPVLRISADSMRLSIEKHETVIDDVAPLGDAAALQGLHETLREARKALPAMEEPVLLLQADRAVSAKLVIAATGAARAAGYRNVLFAI
jgi:biopolymer transport protein ExbD